MLDHLDLADGLARRFTSRPGDRDDLRQVARVGLVNAARRFDPDAGHPFLSFAVPTIVGELKRHLRDRSWQLRPPRRLQELALRLLPAREELTQQLGRVPSAAELAVWLELPVAQVREAIAMLDTQRVDSLDAAIGEDGTPLGDTVPADDDAVERAMTRVELSRACGVLAAADRELLGLRFDADLSQGQIADRLGLSQMQVSRALRRVLRELRTELEGGSAPRSAAAASRPVRPRRRAA